MDSGNSGSIQSSSGGDDEHDSFLHSASSSTAAAAAAAAAAANHHLFDSVSYLDVNPFLTSDHLWPRPFRPPFDPTLNPRPFAAGDAIPPNPPPSQPPAPPPPDPPPPRPSKKRSRASRRAPTTVLTTDTTNFRAMVQEFTGIPASPFASLPSSRSRLDLFARSPPAFVLRPFAQKFHSTSTFAPFSSSTSSSSPTASHSNATTTSVAATTSAGVSTASCTNAIPTNNYQLSHDHLGLNMQNQMFTFQSLLQPPPPKYTLPTYADKSLQVIPSASNYAATDVGGGSMSSLVGGNLVLEGGEQAQLRPGSCKINFSGPASVEFRPEKGGSDGGAAVGRGEGMVDSWICSSD